MFYCNSEWPLIWGIVTGIVQLRVRECGEPLVAALKAKKGNEKGIKAEREMTIILETAQSLCTGSIRVSDTGNSICLSAGNSPSSLREGQGRNTAG